MKKSKAQIYLEECQKLALESGFFLENNNEYSIAAVNEDNGNLILGEEELTPYEALRFGRWIVDMFEEREIAE